MNKSLLQEKIKKSHTQEQLKAWVASLPAASEKRRPTKYRKGDVLMHPIFQHPYILLEFKDSAWICTLMTSDEDFEQNLEKCKSRFFENKYITKTLFTLANPIGSWVNVYENNRHLNSVLKQLKQIFI